MKNKKPEQTDPRKDEMPLQTKNYYLLLAAAVIIVIGFILMTGGRNPSPDVFNFEMFSFRRITLAPIFVVGGFVLAGYAIMKRFEK